MTISLVEKARHNRLIALRALQIRKSGSDQVTIFPCPDHVADRIMKNSDLPFGPMHTLFAA